MLIHKNKNLNIVAFGSPVEGDDDTIRAVKAAKAMQRRAREIDNKLNNNNGLRLKIGIGIATGKSFQAFWVH